eukprot:scaffold7606_cov296-Pinguiococcus_pyrenoidosus.AAC.2
MQDRKPGTSSSARMLYSGAALPLSVGSGSTQTSASMLKPVPQLFPTALDAWTVTSICPLLSGSTLVVRQLSLSKEQSKEGSELPH